MNNAKYQMQNAKRVVPIPILHFAFNILQFVFPTSVTSVPSVVKN
jgi:hypothetical protein